MERLYGQMEANPRNEPGSHKMRLKEHLNPNPKFLNEVVKTQRKLNKNTIYL